MPNDDDEDGGGKLLGSLCQYPAHNIDGGVQADHEHTLLELLLFLF